MTSDTYPGIPTPKAIKPTVLEYVQDGKIYMFGDIYTAMVAYFTLSPEEEKITRPGANKDNQDAPSGDNVFYKYCNNACRDLVIEGMLDDGNGGRYEDMEYRITEKVIGS